MKKIYLATPYSHKEKRIREKRFKEVNKVAAELMGKGFIVFSPISHNHLIAEAGDLPTCWDWWREYDLTFIEWCDELYVYCQEGFMESIGVKAEIALAKEMSKPVIYI